MVNDDEVDDVTRWSMTRRQCRASRATTPGPRVTAAFLQDFFCISYLHFVISFIRQIFLEFAMTQLYITWERKDTTEKSFIFLLTRHVKQTFCRTQNQWQIG